jgi:putative membrane protein
MPFPKEAQMSKFAKVRAAFVAAGVAALVAVPAAPAQAAPSQQDTAFLQAAHQSNLAEIAGGTLAQQKGQSQQVKDLGARFVADHTRLDESLRQTATALGVTLPDAPNPAQQAVAARYQATSGTEFDALFISTQMDAHMEAMRNGQTELREGSDAQAKQVAQAAAPVIAGHHDQLNTAARALGLPTRIDSGTGGEAAPTRPALVSQFLIVVGMALFAGGLVYMRRQRVART